VSGATHWLYSFWGSQSGGDQLNFALYLARGENYFTRPDTYPMLTPQTPGLFPLLLAPWVRLFGPSLLYGNVLGVLSLLVTLAAVAYVGKTISGSWVSVPLGWGLLLGMKRVGEGFGSNRPDSLAAALIAVSLLCLIRYQHGRANAEQTRASLCAAASLIVLAIFAKQLAVGMLVAVTLYFLLTKAWRDLATFLAVVAAVAVPALLLLQWLTHGGYLYNVLTLTKGMTVFSMDRWLRNCSLYTLGSAVGLSLLAITAWRIVRSRTLLHLPLRMLVTIASVMLGAAYATCWHTGGGLHYFIFPNAALAMVGGALAGTLADPARGRSMSWLWILFLLASAGQYAVNKVLPWKTLREAWPAPWSVRRPDLTQTERLFQRTRTLRGEVLFDRLTGIAVLQGRRVEVETSALPVLKRKGLWTSDQLLSDLRTGRWDYVVPLNLDPGRPLVFLSDPQLDSALRQGYTCREVFPLDPASWAPTPQAHLCRSHARRVDR
jgi:hypothetical protein